MLCQIIVHNWNLKKCPFRPFIQFLQKKKKKNFTSTLLLFHLIWVFSMGRWEVNAEAETDHWGWLVWESHLNFLCCIWSYQQEFSYHDPQLLLIFSNIVDEHLYKYNVQVTIRPTLLVFYSHLIEPLSYRCYKLALFCFIIAKVHAYWLFYDRNH